MDELTKTKQDTADLREKFRSAAQFKLREDWRKEADECTRFERGDQWTEEDKSALISMGRPCITINRIRPTVNVLCGFQILNRYEPKFLPRTPDDQYKADIAKGVTKWVDDKTAFPDVESRSFSDVTVTGKGYYWTEVDGGKIKVTRVDPFSVYVDPESIEPDLSDAAHVFRARWTDKGKIARLYPEKKDELDEMLVRYDVAETAPDDTPLYYDKQLKKLRVIEYWAREYGQQNTYLVDGKKLEEVPESFLSASSAALREIGIQRKKEPYVKVTFKVFVGDTMLEEGDSPYKHGQFPCVQMYGYYNGTGYPKGVVSNMIDAQKEINKRRSQMLDIVNRQTVTGWIGDKNALDAKNRALIEKSAAKPGIYIEKNAETNLSRIDPPPIPVGLLSLEAASVDDLKAITGINEELLGVDIAQSASGKAIELRQRQGMTHIAVLFNSLRIARRQLLNILWGEEGFPGLIPQYLTKETYVRIMVDGTEKMIPVNQNDGFATVNDLSKFTFDIVVDQEPNTPSTRIANFYAILEAAKAGVQFPPQVLLDFIDIPQKEKVLQMMNEAMRQQQAMQQLQLQQQASAVSQSQNQNTPPMGQEQVMRMMPGGI